MATLEVAEMVLCGLVNKEIAALVKKSGARAVGIAGKDDGLLVGEKVMKDGKASLGFVGEPKRVDVTILNDFLNAGIIPVIAPIGISETGETLNINADTAAGKIAGALRAKRLLLLTDVAGVLDKEKVLIPHLKLKQVEELKEDGTVTGGMIPKVEMAKSAVLEGVEGAVILDGRVPHAVLLQLLSERAVGTLVSDAVE
ncbi:hypothetical protein NSK_004630 [Nannochloropsis salina CCMP1776]|uniref:Aspartate/glutamate/uridylate kinase domain-containing protein n=1 Tax=Nannochloropsis salina CCMP1776 TaxID=1027361 RepID=A0A4D9D6A8_9STRA|nr:hypothetical protein NSK_004630 [Nannochloropsis salina CCMP1776]|eukprot:TFJ84158.1 hypothetical protein NSK_004630 [Nannochloropsis salina CCMP1776]